MENQKPESVSKPPFNYEINKNLYHKEFLLLSGEANFKCLYHIKEENTLLIFWVNYQRDTPRKLWISFIDIEQGQSIFTDYCEDLPQKLFYFAVKLVKEVQIGEKSRRFVFELATYRKRDKSSLYQVKYFVDINQRAGTQAPEFIRSRFVNMKSGENKELYLADELISGKQRETMNTMARSNYSKFGWDQRTIVD